MKKGGFVYSLASSRNGTLYIGVTSNLAQRIYQHKEHLVNGFSKRYDVINLVWYEQHDTIESSILREKQMKKWKRLWKLRVIEEMNPNWSDLYEDL